MAPRSFGVASKAVSGGGSAAGSTDFSSLSAASLPSACKLMPVSVEVGQTIYYYISSAIELKEDGKKYHFIDETVAVAVSD